MCSTSSFQQEVRDSYRVEVQTKIYTIKAHVVAKIIRDSAIDSTGFYIQIVLNKRLEKTTFEPNP